MAGGDARQIKRKIRAVGNIKKITRAMEMVSAAKLRKVQDRLGALRPYADKIQALLERVAANATDVDEPLLRTRPTVRRVALLAISADKGLCGSYNANIIRKAESFLKAQAEAPAVSTVGRKVTQYAGRRKWDVRFRHQELPLNLPFSVVQGMTRELADLFLRGEVDEVHVAYTEFVNAVTFRPRVARFLPIQAQAASEDGAEGYIFEPEPARILSRLLPRYTEVRMSRILLDALASEHAARMQAMRNATDNAQELIETLTLTYNKARQQGITNELLDIVGGAEALRG